MAKSAFGLVPEFSRKSTMGAYRPFCHRLQIFLFPGRGGASRDARFVERCVDAPDERYSLGGKVLSVVGMIQPA